MALLEVKNIKKDFGKTKVLKDVSFSLEKGQVLAIIGSSGTGIGRSKKEAEQEAAREALSTWFGEN